MRRVRRALLRLLRWLLAPRRHGVTVERFLHGGVCISFDVPTGVVVTSTPLDGYSRIRVVAPLAYQRRVAQTLVEAGLVA